MAQKKKNKTQEQILALRTKKAQRKDAKGTYYKEVRNEVKSDKFTYNFKVLPKTKALRLIGGIAFTRYSKFFQQGILKLATEYVGK